MSRPVRLILGFSKGSASDQIAQVLAPALARELGVGVEVELRPGRNGAIAAGEVSRADPDGRTLFMATLGTHALAPHLDQDLPYHPQRDFAAVALVSSSPLVLACHRSLNVDTPCELVDLARARPGALTYGTSAIGGAPHLAAELFQALTGVELKHVRYDHTDRLYDDLSAGRIALSFNNIMSMLPRCADWRITALAVTSAARSPAAPALPTLAECGVTGYEMSNWLGLVAPASTPHALVEQLGSAARAAMRSAEVTATLADAGVTPRGSTPAEFTYFVAKEIARWGPVVTRFCDAADSNHQELSS